MLSLLLMLVVVMLVCLIIDYIVGQVTDDPRARTVVRAILAFLVLLWLLQASGLLRGV